MALAACHSDRSDLFDNGCGGSRLAFGHISFERSQAAPRDFARVLALRRSDPRTADADDELDQLVQLRDREVLPILLVEMQDVVCRRKQEIARGKRVNQLAQEHGLRGIVFALVPRLLERCQELVPRDFSLSRGAAQAGCAALLGCACALAAGEIACALVYFSLSHARKTGSAVCHDSSVP